MERESGDVEAAARDDLEFHRVIARATQNELYLLLMDSIGSALIDIRRENLGSGSAPTTLEQHAACSSGSPRATRTARGRRWRPTSRASPPGGARTATRRSGAPA